MIADDAMRRVVSGIVKPIGMKRLSGNLPNRVFKPTAYKMNCRGTRAVPHKIMKGKATRATSAAIEAIVVFIAEFSDESESRRSAQKSVDWTRD